MVNLVGRTILLAAGLLVLSLPGQIPIPTNITCVVVGTPSGAGRLNLTCADPKLLSIQGPVGPIGPQGPPGPSGSGITGGPCLKADNSFGLFTQLPDGSCLPIVGSGNITVASGGMIDKSGNPVVVAFRFVGPEPVQPQVMAYGLSQGK